MSEAGSVVTTPKHLLSRLKDPAKLSMQNGWLNTGVYLLGFSRSLLNE